MTLSLSWSSAWLRHCRRQHSGSAGRPGLRQLEVQVTLSDSLRLANTTTSGSLNKRMIMITS
eukprot:260380-Rhodomonas_salina.1